MAIKAELSRDQACFNEKTKISIKSNETVDVYMYYHTGGASLTFHKHEGYPNSEARRLKSKYQYVLGPF